MRELVEIALLIVGLALAVPVVLEVALALMRKMEEE